MATLAANLPPVEKRDARRREHRFFFGLSLAIAVTFFIGFAKTYFLAGYFHAKPLPAPVVHVHAAVFTAWVLLLVTQAALAASGNVRIHHKLGLLGLGLAPLVFVLGVLAAHEMVGRVSGIFGPPRAALLYAVALGEITGFALPVFLALRLRRWPGYHKRLIMIGTIAMTTAGFGRWPVAFLLHKPFPAMCCAFALLAFLGGFDLLSMRRIHRATIFGSAWVIGIELLSLPLSHTAAWQAFAAWSRSV